MITFNLIRKKRPNGKIAKFYNNYESLNLFGKALWHIIFVNWIPMVASIALLLIAGICWNFVECPGFFYTALSLVGVTFLPWIVYGFSSIFRKEDILE